MKNKTIIKLVQKLLLDLLSQCNDYQQGMFKRMYSHNDLDKPIQQVIQDMDPEKLEWAVTQVENTLSRESQGGQNG